MLALVAGAASAQQLRTFGTPDRGYTVQTPGQSPTYVTPTPGGGYTFQTPGQLPTYAAPNTGGGYILQQSAGRQRTCARNKPRLSFKMGVVSLIGFIQQ